jgi:two-component system, LytTR family, response regulator
LEKKLTGIAVDDEPIALDIIRKHAEKVPFLDLRAVFSSASAALAYLQTNDTDVVFLDINMPDLSGLDLAQAVRQKTKIIFTTAYPEFAVKGFDLSATDYLLKPIGWARFMEACMKANQSTGIAQAPARDENCLFVKDGYDWVRIDINRILFVEADDNYVTFYETDKKTIVRMTLGAALDKLSDTRFIRIHKSYVVSLPKVEKIEPHQVLIGAHKIPVSASYRDALMEGLKRA